MNSVTLGKIHLHLLTDENLRKEFVEGIISLLQGKEPKATCTFIKDIFNLLAHGYQAKVIPGIPKFDLTGMKKKEALRFEKIQAGKVPSNGLDHAYKDLQFKAITILDKEYLKKLHKDCQDRINKKHGDAEYRRFIGYLAEVLKYCADSGEL